MRREVTLTQALSWLAGLVAGAAALSWAFLLVLADREQRAVTFAAGGLALVAWAAIHLTDRQHTHR